MKSTFPRLLLAIIFATNLLFQTGMDSFASDPTTSDSSARALDVVLVFDASESMTYDAPASDPMRDPGQCNSAHNCHPFEEAKEAAEAFINRLNFPNDRVAVVTFDNSARVDLGFSSDRGEIQNVIDALGVVDPGICPTETGPCREYARDTNGNIVDGDSDGFGDVYYGFDCPIYHLTGNPDTCGTTAIGLGLQRATNEFNNQATFREDALRAVILVSDGATNGPSFVCPNSTWTTPFCRDRSATSRHCADPDDTSCLSKGGVYAPDQYDTDDYARDMADFLSEDQGALLYSIGLGPLVQTSIPIDANGWGAGEQLLRYAADVGSGQYYYADTGDQLDDIFLDIYYDIPSGPKTLIVTKTADSDDGMCSNDCSLREAIAIAPAGSTINFDPSLAGQTIPLSSTLILDKDLVIDGANLISHVQISGDSNGDGIGDVSVFQITGERTVEFTGLDIVKGSYTSAATGGAVNNDGNLTVTNCSFAGNSGDQGGAIHNSGSLTVSNGSFISNTAIEGGAILSDAGTVTFISNSTFTSNTTVAQAGLRGAGGAVANAGTLTVNDSDFSENSANGEGGGALLNVSPGLVVVRDSAFTGNSTTKAGGAINNYSGEVQLSNVTLRNNTAFAYGGGIYNNYKLTILNSSLIDNTAGDGGGVFNADYGILDIKNNTFTNNRAVLNDSDSEGAAGALLNFGMLTVTDSIFISNFAEGGGGGIVNTFLGSTHVQGSTFAENSTPKFGGAIYNFSGTLAVSNSNFSTNSAGLGAAINAGNKDPSIGVTEGDSDVTIVSSTFSGNHADAVAGGLHVFSGAMKITNSTFSSNTAESGGGIVNIEGEVEIRNSTFYGNTSSVDPGGGIYNGGSLILTNSTISDNVGGGLYNVIFSSVSLQNNLVANSINRADCYNAGTLTSATNNLIEVNGSGEFSCGTPVSNADPQLGPLADNGGLTQTMALLPGSPAIDAGDNATCESTDQRGVARPYGPGCDLGAFELEYALPVGTTTTVSCDSPITYGSSTTCTATVTRAFSGYTPGGSVSWTNPDSGTFSTSSCTLSGSGGSASCSVSYTPGAVGDGVHRITASYGGDAHFSGSSGSRDVTVNTKALVPSITAGNKVYDRTTSATILTRSLSGVVGADTVSLTGGTASFSDKNVGNGKTVTGSGFSLSGAQAGNYRLSPTTATTTANITGRNLTVSATGVNKVYDGTTSATVTLTTNALTGDAVTAAYTTASFATPGAGNNKTISVSGISVSGADAGNYSLSSTTATTAANINARSLTVSATGVNKVYDGTTGATVTLTTNALAGDAVTAAYTAASFATPDAGNNKTITVSGISISGADAGNYSLLSTTASASADVTPKPLTVRADNKSKLVGEPDPDFTYTASGFVGSDTFITAPTCSVPVLHDMPDDYEIVCTGGVAGANYTVGYVNGTLTVTSPTCYALTLSHTGQGSDPLASPSNSPACPAGQYQAGASINLSGATPESGWQIGGWSGTQDDSSTASTNTVSMPPSDHAVSVTYLEIAPQVSILKSIATQDGWLLESSENSNKGGTIQGGWTYNSLFLGDEAHKKQYRSILSFSTKGLPDDARITEVILKIKKRSVVGGGNPVNVFQGFLVDVRQGFFGSAARLQVSDFEAKASQSYGPFKPALINGWYAIDLTPARDSINREAINGGVTQIRLRFKLDDNNNAIANYLSLYSGNAPAESSRPQLIIEYYVP